MVTMMLKSTKYQYSVRLDLPPKTAYFFSASRYQLNPRPPHLRELFARLPKSILACPVIHGVLEKGHTRVCVERAERIRPPTNFGERRKAEVRRIPLPRTSVNSAAKWITAPRDADLLSG